MLSSFLVLSLSVFGFSLSLYAYLIDRKLKQNPSYKPACDISDMVSCTKPMKSSYANVFFVSNAVLGMMYYVLVVLLVLLGAPLLLLIATIIAAMVSTYLGYVLYFKIKSLCLICTSLYILNGLLFVCAIQIYMKG